MREILVPIRSGEGFSPRSGVGEFGCPRRPHKPEIVGSNPTYRYGICLGSDITRFGERQLFSQHLDNYIRTAQAVLFPDSSTAERPRT